MQFAGTFRRCKSESVAHVDLNRMPCEMTTPLQSGSGSQASDDIHRTTSANDSAVEDNLTATSHILLRSRNGGNVNVTNQVRLSLMNLPHEIFVLVLLYLDTKSLSRIAATCWTLFNEPNNPIVDALRLKAKSSGRVSPDLLLCRFSSLASQLAWLECRRDEAWMPVATGWSSSFFVSSAGRLMSCGSEAVGQNGVLGHGDEHRELGIDCNVIPSPTSLPTMTGIRINRISAGSGFSVAVSADGMVYTWGKGNYGCLGHGNADSSPVPKLIHALTSVRITSVAAGHFHCLAVTEEGALYSWGHTQFGRCGHSVSLPTENGLRTVEATPRIVTALQGTRVRSASAADYHSMVVTESGALYSFGYGAHGEVCHGRDEYERNPTMVQELSHVRITVAVTGGRHALALTQDGLVYAWGYNRNGQLGIGYCGRSEHTPLLVDTLRNVNVCSVAAGFGSSYAITRDGTLFTWGCGESGQLGHGDTSNQNTPKRVKALREDFVVALSPGHRESTVAVTRNGRVFGWGTAKGFGLPMTPFENAQGVVCSSIPCQYPDLICCR